MSSIRTWRLAASQHDLGGQHLKFKSPLPSSFENFTLKILSFIYFRYDSILHRTSKSNGMNKKRKRLGLLLVCPQPNHNIKYRKKNVKLSL
jgi:hypothetical protein